MMQPRAVQLLAYAVSVREFAFNVPKLMHGQLPLDHGSPLPSWLLQPRNLVRLLRGQMRDLPADPRYVNHPASRLRIETPESVYTLDGEVPWGGRRSPDGHHILDVTRCQPAACPAIAIRLVRFLRIETPNVSQGGRPARVAAARPAQTLGVRHGRRQNNFAKRTACVVSLRLPPFPNRGMDPQTHSLTCTSHPPDGALATAAPPV